MIGLTGSTGQLGSRIARLLAEAGVPQRLIVRDPARALDPPAAEVVQAAYGEAGFRRGARRGRDPDVAQCNGVGGSDRLAQGDCRRRGGSRCPTHRLHVVHRRVAGCDVHLQARDHWHTEEHIRSLGVDFIFLRDNLYLDFVTGYVGEDGVIRGPAGDGRVAAVARDDVAAVAARVLVDPATPAPSTT